MDNSNILHWFWWAKNWPRVQNEDEELDCAGSMNFLLKIILIYPSYSIIFNHIYPSALKRGMELVTIFSKSSKTNIVHTHTRNVQAALIPLFNEKDPRNNCTIGSFTNEFMEFGNIQEQAY